jgi:hypothetical protein
VLLGGDGNDLLVGGGGADGIDGGAGDDDLSPQSSMDSFDAGDGADDVAGGPGTDLVRYQQTLGSVRISLDDTADDGQGGEGDNVHSDVENVNSAGSNDVIVGSNVANAIDAAGGDDSISGGDGNDTLNGLTGNDVISGDAGDDSLLGGTGSNILDGGPGLDRFGPSAFSCAIFDCSLGIDEFRANDGVQEFIDCFGVAGSKAIVDALDIVANCTTVIRPPGLKPIVDRTRPALTAYGLSPTRFSAASKGATIATPAGATIRFKLSEPATVTFRIEKAAGGRRVKGRCVKASRSNRKAKRCTRYLALQGTSTVTGKAGSNSRRFSGRLSGRKLAQGRYRLVATARDAAGNASKPKRVAFKIVRR